MNFNKAFFNLIIFFNLSLFAQDSLKLEWATNFFGPSTYTDRAADMVIDENGYIYITGTMGSSLSSYEIVTIKYTPGGDEEWVKINKGMDSPIAEAVKIGIDSLNNIYVAGRAYTDTTFNDYYLVKYNSEGELIWEQTYDGGSGDWAGHMVLDKKSNIILAGWAYNDGKQECLIVKYNSNGIFQWANTYSYNNMTNDYVGDISTDDSCNVYIVGSSDVTYPSTSLTIKYNKDGEEVWVKNEAIGLGAIIKNGNNTTIYAGYSNAGPSENGLRTVQFDRAGNEIWSSVYYEEPEAHSGYIQDIEIDQFNNVYVVGWLSLSNNGSSQYILLKYDKDGNEKWHKGIYDLQNNRGFARSMELDIDGNIFIAGDVGEHPGDMFISKYDSDGNQEIFKRYNSKWDNVDKAKKILFDQQDNIFLFGTSDTITTVISTITLLKYKQEGLTYIKEVDLTKSFNLYQNYPNPFNPSTKIRFYLNSNSKVELVIYDILGKKIKTLINKELSSGSYEAYWNGENDLEINSSSGIYYYKLKSEKYTEVKKMLLIK